MKYRFRDKLVLAFAVLLVVTMVPVLVLVNTQIEAISAAKIGQDLVSTALVFRRFQSDQLASFAERTANFILTQPVVRAELATAGASGLELFPSSPTDPSGTVNGGAQPVEPLSGDPAEPASEPADPFGAVSAGGDSESADPFGAVTAEPDTGAGDPFGAVAADAEAAAEEPSGAGGTTLGPQMPTNRQSVPDRPPADIGAPAQRAALRNEGAVLPLQQNLLLSVMEDVGLYRESALFFLVDARGRLLFNKADPTLHGVPMTGLPEVVDALSGVETFAWWGSDAPLGSDSPPAGLFPATVGRRLFQIFLKPLQFGEEVKGVLAVGFALDEPELRQITGITRSEIAFMTRGRVYLNSREDVPPEVLASLPITEGRLEAAEPLEFLHKGESFLTLTVPVSNPFGQQVGRVVVYRSKTREKAVFDDLRTLLTAIGVAALAIAGLLALGVSHSVSRAVRALFEGVAQVRRGNLDHRLDLRSRDEFGELGEAFNEMTAGLREKEHIRDTFKRYVSSSVVDEILASGEAVQLGGESRTLAILFSDIASFTSLSEQLSAEAVVAFLNTYLSEMTAIIEAEQGIVDKYIGDAVMAFWGAPLKMDAPALPACRAALAQVRRLPELRRRWGADSPLAAFDIRIGLHMGEVVVGNIGSNTRMDYTVIGDSVNTASRLEGLNKVYGTQILVTEAVAREVGTAMCLREVDWIRPVGKRTPVGIYELQGPLEEDTPQRREVRERFAEGLALYREGEFARGRQVFEALKAQAPDKAVDTFLKRCDDFMHDPPPRNWDGVFDATGK